MDTISVDFDVYKWLTMQRENEKVTYNDVLRRLAKLPPIAENPKATVQSGGLPWVSKGVSFPHGTKFRASYKGKYYLGSIENGVFLVDGKSMKSPSEASHKITGNSVNGWRFWECCLPGSNTWKIIDTMR